jgi:RNA polymerase sigma factor (sigma-70 family)
LVATLVRVLGDFAVAEEIVQETLLVALQRWPVDGIPDNPGAWLTTAARRKAIDLIRRDQRYREKLALLDQAPLRYGPVEVDDRLRLIFTCCHPALSREAQVALTLRAVAGFTTSQIARAFLVSESTVAQRIVRARRKIVEAGIPYRVPDAREATARLGEVLAVLYLMFNEGYLSTGGEAPAKRDLAEDAAWLAGLVARLMPQEPETLGLWALMRLHLARADTRFDNAGNLVLLQDQDRARWDRAGIAAAVQLVERAGAMRRPGPYQLQAAIAACHAEAASWEATDWAQVVALYDALVALTPSPVVRLNRAVALRFRSGPEAALPEVDALAAALDGYHLFHSTRAELLGAMGQADEAAAAQRRALALTSNPAERALIESRLTVLGS